MIGQAFRLRRDVTYVKKGMKSAGSRAIISVMQPEHPTGLEIRFERELATVVPGWKSEIASIEPLVEARPPREAKKRVIPRHIPHRRRITGRLSAEERKS